MFDYMSEARLQTETGSESGFTLGPGQTRFDAQGNPIAQVGAAPAGDRGQVMLAQQVLANPASTPEQIAAANVVVETGGATTLPQAVQALTAGAPTPETPSAAEQEIARLMSLGYSREDAVLAQAGVLQLDSDGVLRNTITGEPVLPQTSGLSVDSAGAVAGPPRDTTGTSLFDRVGQTTGVLSAGAGVLESTVGQLTGTALFPERAQSIQELNTLRGVLVDAFRNSGRLLSQELNLLLDEVAPGSSVFQSPGQLRAKMEAIDAELRQRLAEERARAADPGVPTRERTASANLSRDIERVLVRLHQPSPTAIPDNEQFRMVLSNPMTAQPLQEIAAEVNMTPEQLWALMSPQERETFLISVED
jgi:hypothetical protein